MFLRNYWYVAAYSREVTRESPFGRVMLGSRWSSTDAGTGRRWRSRTVAPTAACPFPWAR